MAEVFVDFHQYLQDYIFLNIGFSFHEPWEGHWGFQLLERVQSTHQKNIFQENSEKQKQTEKMNFPEFRICMSTCTIWWNTQGKGEALCVLLKKASLNAENSSYKSFCWKLPFISSALIMSHLKVPVVQIKVEAKTLKHYVLVVWKFAICFQCVWSPCGKLKNFTTNSDLDKSLVIFSTIDLCVLLTIHFLDMRPI